MQHPKQGKVARVTKRREDRITLPMSREMRRALAQIAERLQHERKRKTERITSNTIARIAIRAFIETIDCMDLNGVSNEDELWRAVKKSRS